MNKVRFGIIGVGGMGSGHARIITEAKSKDFSLAAVADIDAARAEAVGRQYGVPHFTDGLALMDSGLVDAVIIATPHYFHPPLTIAAARRKRHVLSEKPIAVAVGPARAAVEECRKNKVAMGVMFQQRTRPDMIKVKQMVDSGAIGPIIRIQMICSSWYRSQAYYDSGTWRGTWNGEGGGILINQAPHSLDLFQWIGGMPARVLATVGTRTHKIEVENTANAVLTYPDGHSGYIYATTAESPGVERLIVAGEKGTLVAEDGKVMFGKLDKPLTKHLFSDATWGHPEVAWKELPLPKGKSGHIEVTKAFVNHILKGKPLVAAGVEGLNELELSNAVYISGYRGKAVELPVKAAEMERLLADLAKKHDTGKSPNYRTAAAGKLKKLLGKLPA